VVLAVSHRVRACSRTVEASFNTFIVQLGFLNGGALGAYMGWVRAPFKYIRSTVHGVRHRAGHPLGGGARWIQEHLALYPDSGGDLLRYIRSAEHGSVQRSAITTSTRTAALSSFCCETFPVGFRGACRTRSDALPGFYGRGSPRLRSWTARC